MIHVFIATGCSSCRRLLLWFKNHDIPVREHMLKHDREDDCGMSKEMLYHLLSLSEDGFDEFISRRSLAFQEIRDTYEDMSTSQLVDYIYLNPTCLRRPITVKGDVFTVGFDREELTMFLPGNRRNKTRF